MILLFLFYVCQSLRIFPGCLSFSIPLFMAYLHYVLFILLFFLPPQTKTECKLKPKKNPNLFPRVVLDVTSAINVIAAE